MAKKTKEPNVTYKYDFDKNRIDTFSKKVEEVDTSIAAVEKQDVTPLVTFFNKAKEQKMPVCFYGSGGAFAPATYAMQLANAEGLVAMVLTPMQVMTLSEGAIRQMMFLAISGGGSPNDMVSATSHLLNIIPEHVFCMTTSPIDKKDRYGRYSNKVGQLMNAAMPDNTLCVSLPVHQDGYVGSKKHVGMALLIYRALHPEETDLVSKLILPDEEPFEVRLPEGMTMADISDLHILYGALGQCAAIDIEGRMLECGVLPTMVTDFKNFTHGRHTYTNVHKQSTILMLISPRDEAFVKDMLKLIPKDKPVIFIRTKRDDLLGALQLMIRTFYLSIDICAPRGVNPFKPEGKAEWGGKLWSLTLEGKY